MTLAHTGLSPAELQSQWDREGYTLIRGFSPPEEVRTLLALSDHAREQWRVCDASHGKPVGGDGMWLMRHVNHPAYFRDRRDWLATLLDLSADPRVIDVARTALGEEPVFVHTTYWFNPLFGHVNGDWHRDTQFLTKTDDDERRMLFTPGEQLTGAQVQIALVASDDTEVVPGSHRRWDTPEEYRIRKSDGLKHARAEDGLMPGALRVALEPGDAVAFNPCALHRGRYYLDKPRKTLMLSYGRLAVKRGNDYFTHQPWMLEESYFAGTRPETRAFMQRTIDAWGSEWPGDSGPGGIYSPS